MKRKDLLIIIILVITFSLSGCTTNLDTNLKNELETKNELISTMEKEKQELENRIAELEEEQETEPIPQNSLLQTSLNVVEIINDKDMKTLSNFIHPTKGVRFSAYGHIDVSKDLTFTNTQVEGLMNDTQVYTWGSYDGSGEPIKLNFADYYNEFIYDETYKSPNMIGNNISIAQGNIINNIADAYPNGEFVDFHFSGFDPQYEGLDWSSLKLVFEEDNGTWYLVGIVHDQWTV